MALISEAIRDVEQTRLLDICMQGDDQIRVLNVQGIRPSSVNSLWQLVGQGS